MIPITTQFLLNRANYFIRVYQQLILLLLNLINIPNLDNHYKPIHHCNITLSSLQDVYQ
jgi:hypothetical protein